MNLPILLLLLGATAAFGGTPDQATRPNIIVVLVDDAGYRDFPYFEAGGSWTPEIDRLAREGIRFTNFYVNAPICSPSRAALITGQFPARVGITSFIASSAENRRRGMGDWLDPHHFTLPRALHQAGYATGHFGKWHLGGGRDVAQAPLITEYGFDDSLTNFEGLGDRVLPLISGRTAGSQRKLPLGKQSEALGQGDVTWQSRDEVTGAFVTRALDFIRQAEEDKQPFYINLWPDDVHTPLFPPVELMGDGGKRERYLGVLRNMDSAFGRLFEYIRSQPELRDNTVVMVLSDNGHEPGAGSAGDLRGAKGQLYEGGIREPLIVWAPGWLASDSIGSTNESTVLSSVDLVASLLSIADTPGPDPNELDGEDLTEALLGRRAQTREEPLFWQRPPDRPRERGENLPDLAIRDGPWKLLMDEGGENLQLYNLGVDPTEAAEVAGKHPDIARRLVSRLRAWEASIANGAEPKAEAASLFTNPIAEGADPWVMRHDGLYYYCLSHANRAITVHASETPVRLGSGQTVWEAPATGPYSSQIWAPELHRLGGRWYIYFAASDGQNRNHRTYVLASESDDPLGDYTLHGPLYTGDTPDDPNTNRWSIDASPLELGGKRYLLWSGWERDQDEQHLYIAPMNSPVRVAGPRVRLADNDDYLWERVGESAEGRGLNEGPQVLQRDERTFVVYSCSGSWEPTYKLGLLYLTKTDEPLNATSWRKSPNPVFASTAHTYGVGHASFVKSPDGTEDWIIYHAKQERRAGWHRAIFAQPFSWDARGLPQFGEPMPRSYHLALPSGTAPRCWEASKPYSQSRFSEIDDWTYYGHHQLLAFEEGSLHLGRLPDEPVNLFRAGEKLLLDEGDWEDVIISTTIKHYPDPKARGGADAGILFRIQKPAVGYDTQHGYFAGVLPRQGLVILGKTDGLNWSEISRARVRINPTRSQVLSVTAVGTDLRVSIDGREVLAVSDASYRRGQVGLRVVDTHAAFSNFNVELAKAN